VLADAQTDRCSGPETVSLLVVRNTTTRPFPLIHTRSSGTCTGAAWPKQVGTAIVVTDPSVRCIRNDPGTIGESTYTATSPPLERSPTTDSGAVTYRLSVRDTPVLTCVTPSLKDPADISWIRTHIARPVKAQPAPGTNQACFVYQPSQIIELSAVESSAGTRVPGAAAASNSLVGAWTSSRVPSRESRALEIGDKALPFALVMARGRDWACAAVATTQMHVTAARATTPAFGRRPRQAVLTVRPANIHGRRVRAYVTLICFDAVARQLIPR
jgi:hypothetical protein